MAVKADHGRDRRPAWHAHRLAAAGRRWSGKTSGEVGIVDLDEATGKREIHVWKAREPVRRLFL